MLQTIREHTQGWIAGAIISLIILSFALWGIHSYFTGAANNTNVAKVNGIEITKEQLAVAYERLRRQTQSQFGSSGLSSTKDQSILKQRALQTLIDVEVLKQSSLDQGFRVSDRQIYTYLRGMPEFQVDGQFSFDRFQELLSSTLLSTSEFLDLIRTSLLIDQPKLGFIFTSFALNNEGKEIIELVNQERDISYLVIPTSRFAQASVNIKQDAINDYYTQHQSEYMTPEQVNVEYLELSLKSLSDTIKPSESILKNFYNETINSYTKPSQWKVVMAEWALPVDASPEVSNEYQQQAANFVKHLTPGSDVNQLAKQYNAKLTKEDDWKSLNQIPSELQKAVSALGKQGQVSEPIQTSKGWVVVQVQDMQGPKMQTFEEVKDKVMEAYIRQHAEDKFAEQRERLADLTYENPESLEPAAKSLGLQVQTSKLFEKDKPGTDISQHKKVREIAFSNDVLNLQNNSEVIQLNPETAVVVRVKSHMVSKLLPITEVQAQISDKLKSSEIDTLAYNNANELLKQLVSGASMSELAAKSKLSVSNPGYIGRYTTKVDNAILDLAFRMPNPKSINKPQSYAVAKLANGYAVVALNSIKPGVVQDQKQEQVYSEQIQTSDGLLEYELYKLSQTNKASIKVYQ